MVPQQCHGRVLLPVAPHISPILPFSGPVPFFQSPTCGGLAECCSILVPCMVSTYTTVSSAAACATGWGCLSTAHHTPAQSAAALRIPTVTTKLDVHGGNGDRIARHNAIRDVIFSAAQSAALAPSKEAPGLVPGSHARPADVFLPSWSLGRPAALDVHVISPLHVLTVADAALTPGHALQVGVQRKLASNLSACRSSGTDFVPLVAETLGGLAEYTISAITYISRAIADRSSSPDPASTSRHLFAAWP